MPQHSSPRRQPYGTPSHCEIGTGISEASMRRGVPIFPYATLGGKQVSSHFQKMTGKQVQAHEVRTGSDPVSCRLTQVLKKRVMLLRASARKLHDFWLSMTQYSRSPAPGSAKPPHRVHIEVGHTDKACRTQTSGFLIVLEELIQISKIVPIASVPISR